MPDNKKISETKTKLNFSSIVTNTKEIPKLVINPKPDGWLTYGADNKYPVYLFYLYEHSSQFSSIASSMKDYILGDEVINNTNLSTINRKGETFNDLLEKITLDYIIYGGFAFQVVRNKLGGIAELNYIDFRTARTNEDEDKIYINKSWKYDIAKRRTQTKVYERFMRGTKQPNSIYYYKGHITREEYPVPMYMAAITSLEISTQIANYHLSNILNNFTPSAVINFNSGSNLSEDVMQEAEDMVYEKFSGTSNAGKIIISFNDSKDNATTIERLQDDGLDNKYQNLATSVKADIYSAFRINECLVGLNKETGFSKTEFSEAFTLYNKTVIRPIQQDLIDALETVLGEKCIEIKPFSIDWGEGKEGAVGENAEIVE